MYRLKSKFFSCYSKEGNIPCEYINQPETCFVAPRTGAWIETSDTLQQITRLYTGDGYRDTGIYYSKILNPVCSYDSLYFKFDDGGLYRMRFDSLQISFVDFCDGYIKAWGN